MFTGNQVESNHINIIGDTNIIVKTNIIVILTCSINIHFVDNMCMAVDPGLWTDYLQTHQFQNLDKLMKTNK